MKSSCSPVNCLNLTRAAGEHINNPKNFGTVQGGGVKLGFWCSMGFGVSG